MTDSSQASGPEDRRPELVMHYREGCHLCEDMQQQLGELLEPDEFRLTLIDIDEDEQLRQAYNVRVPVLSLVPLEHRRWRENGDSAGLSTVSAGQNRENRAEIGFLEELCEHFLDLVAVRQALASYNTAFLATRSVRADR